jgi:hypothetical protein
MCALRNVRQSNLCVPTDKSLQRSKVAGVVARLLGPYVSRNVGRRNRHVLLVKKLLTLKGVGDVANLLPGCKY